MKKVVLQVLAVMCLLCVLVGCTAMTSLDQADFQGEWTVDEEASGYSDSEAWWTYEISGTYVRKEIAMDSEYFPGQTTSSSVGFYELEIDGQNAYFCEWNSVMQEYERKYRVEVSGNRLTIYSGSDFTRVYEECYK